MTGQILGLLPALALVALGGALGSMARLWVSGVVARRQGQGFPLGTLVVNVTGAAAIGVISAVLMEPGSHAVERLTLWAALVIGILGSYTTVSSFSLQTLALAREGRPGRAAANVILSVVLCLAAAWGARVATAQVLAMWGAP